MHAENHHGASFTTTTVTTVTVRWDSTTCSYALSEDHCRKCLKRRLVLDGMWRICFFFLQIECQGNTGIFHSTLPEKKKKQGKQKLLLLYYKLQSVTSRAACYNSLKAKKTTTTCCSCYFFLSFLCLSLVLFFFSYRELVAPDVENAIALFCKSRDICVRQVGASHRGGERVACSR